MKWSALVPAMFVVVAADNLAQCADVPAGIVSGWESNSGSLLLGELNCAACHPTAGAAEHLTKRQPPKLGEVGRRVTPQYLRAFLAKPHEVKPGSWMPDVLHGLPDGQRTETVEALTHYLVSLGGPIDQKSSGASRVQIQRGQDLYHKVGCVACHEPFAPPSKQKSDLPPGLDIEELVALNLPGTAAPRPSVPLGQLSMKTTVDQLAAFLLNPLHVRPSGRMPNLKLKPGEARFIAAYLLRDQFTEGQTAPGIGIDITYYAGSFPRVPDFESLKTEPVWEGEGATIDLKAIQLPDGKTPSSNFAVQFSGAIDIPEEGKYQFWTKSDDGSILKIDEKVVVNNDGMHPPTEKQGEVTLRPGRHSFDLGFVQGGGGFELSAFWQPPGADKRELIPGGVLLRQSASAMIPKGIVDFTVNSDLAAKGKELFGKLGCAHCHDTDKPATPRAESAPLLALNPMKSGGCLSDAPAAGRPRYFFSPSQREELAGTLVALNHAAPGADATRLLNYELTARNCYACHRRDGKGGPDIRRSQYFTYDVLVDLGDEGRLPPPLDEVGAKLTAAGFEDALQTGTPYRTYMAARMPLFGKDNISHLPALFTQVDAGKVAAHEPQFSPKMIDSGRYLVGKRALGCINCHAWGQFRLQGAEGLDLLQITRRIKPDWFHSFVLDPQPRKPRTRMPTGWPNGKSSFPKLEDGDTHQQIDAIWAWLTVGEKGGMPFGLSPDDNQLLMPTEEPIVFRTFLNQVSAHAILVGFRQRTHVAFDANRVRMAATWTGNFISAKSAWEGRAGQYAAIPSNDVIRFPDGPTFAVLQSPGDAWPKDVPKQGLGSRRTPEGWKFLGYRFNDQRIPTFRYRMNGIEIEETPSTDYARGGSVLTRHFRLTSDDPVANVYLRVGTGQSIDDSAKPIVIDARLKYDITSSSAAQPVVRDVDGGQELLVPVVWKKNGQQLESTITLLLTW